MESKMYRYVRLAFCLATLLQCVTSYAQSNADSLASGAVPASGMGAAPPSYIDFAQKDSRLARYGAIDETARWNQNVLTVCWLNHPEYKGVEREWVRDAVAVSWEAASQLRFVGWGDCGPTPSDVQISVDETGPRAFVGRRISRATPGMWLNFTFNSWSPACQQKRERCIRAIAVHEFGHVAGFEHEQLAKGAPQACIDHLKQSGQWETVDVPPLSLTPYDPDSVMNYCNAIWANNGALSPNDKLAIGILFGN